MCLNCHVVTIDIEIKNIAALKAACKRLGWSFHQTVSNHRWFGSWVDDSPTPRHMFATDDEYSAVAHMSRAQRQEHMTKLLGNPEHSIVVPDHDYHIGVHKIGDNYQLAFDEWHGSIAAGERNDLAQAYAVEQAKLTAQARGELYSEQILQDGTIELHVQIGE